MLRLDINLLWTVLNILIWYLLIWKFLFKPVNAVISKREEEIASRYAAAQKLQEEAKAEKDRCEQFETKIREEQEKAVAEAKENARAEYDRIVKEAQKKAEQIVESSKKEAELQKNRILSKTEQEIRSLIMDTAVQSMQASGDDKELYDQFLIKAGEQHAE